MTDFDFQPTLTGDLVQMRPYVEADWDDLFAVASDPLIWEIHPMHDRWQEPVFRQNIDWAVEDKGGLVAVDRQTGKIIGFSRYSQTKCRADEVEIGWTFLSRDYWGGTYNRDMKRVMLVHALVSFPAVVFRVGEGNLRSRGAMVKIGGQLLDRRDPVIIGDREVMHVSYVITRQSFAAGPLA